jgi:hypothetical protein
VICIRTLQGRRNWGGGHILADQLTPSQLGGSIYALQVTTRPPPSQTLLRPCLGIWTSPLKINQKTSIFPALIILPGTHRRYKNEKPSIKWVLFTNASHNTILHFVAIRFMSIQMLKSTQCTELGFTNW